MKKKISKIENIWEMIRKPLAIFMAAVIISLFGIYLFSQTRIAGDTASHILLAISPLLKIGSPYKDFWEIKPPAWPLTVFIWSSLFGYGILSIKIINLLVVSLIAFFTYSIYKKVFRTPITEILFAFTLLINFSPLLNTLIFPTEILGLMLSLLALLILLESKNNFWKFFLSGFLFFLASQSKEPYTFTIISALPVFLLCLLQKGFFKFAKSVLNFFFGLISGFGLLLAYLASLGSLKAYTQVFQYKEIFFPFDLDRMSRNFNPALTATNNTFIEFQGGILILILLVFLIFLFANKFKRLLVYQSKSRSLISKPLTIIDDNNVSKFAVFFYATGSFLGLGLGGNFGSHYLIQVPVSFYLLAGLAVSYIYAQFVFLADKGKIFFLAGLIVFIFSLVIVLPKRQYIKSYLPGKTNFVLRDDVYGYERRISDLTTKDQCVLSVYGWGVSENYLYSGRKPCTRFFLANIVKEEWQKKEYAQSVIENPPALIVYRIGGADMDVPGFERDVINIGKIVKNCYKKDTKEDIIFLPKAANMDALRKCIILNSK